MKSFLATLSCTAALAIGAYPLHAQDAQAAASDGAPAVQPQVEEELTYEGEKVYTRSEDFETSPRLRRGDALESLPAAEDFAARKRGQQVKAKAIVLKDGSLTDFTFVEPSGIDEVDAAIEERVASWLLYPARVGGEPVLAQIAVAPWIGYRPEKVSGDFPVLSEEAKRLGHHGVVVISGRVAEDGSFVDAEVSSSSRSELVDQAALDAARQYRYEAPIGLDGQPFSYKQGLSFELSQALGNSNSVLEGMKEYSCRAFIAEYDWWLSANPEADPKDYRLRKILVGATFVLGLDRVRTGEGLKNMLAQFDRSWDKSIEACRQKPEREFLKVYRKS